MGMGYSCGIDLIWFYKVSYYEEERYKIKGGK